jgi:hypothetical protein
MNDPQEGGSTEARQYKVSIHRVQCEPLRPTSVPLLQWKIAAGTHVCAIEPTRVDPVPERRFAKLQKYSSAGWGVDNSTDNTTPFQHMLPCCMSKLFSNE